MKTIILMTLLLGLSTSAVMAGGVGNGGISVVCRDQNQKISSAELLDIYEGRVIYGKKYINNVNSDTKIELAQLKIVIRPNFLERFQNELASARSITRYIPEGNILSATNDALPKIEKKNCKFEQVANYTNDNELLISEEIYNSFDDLNRAALLVHETNYKIYRSIVGDKTSERARKLTAEMLAVNADQKLIEKMISFIVPTTPTLTRDGRPVCGIQGTLDEKINDCHSTTKGFALVTRMVSGIEIYKEIATGLLWSDRLLKDMNLDDAEKVCNGNLPEVAGLIEYSWKLPSIYDYMLAETHGIRSALSDMKDFYYWSSTVNPKFDITQFFFKGEDGRTFHDIGESHKSVRCVATAK